MSNWTNLVGDPVLSKWIVVMLSLSVALNGYLLKGIAAGTGLHFSLVETGRAVTRGVRFIKDKDEFDEKEREVV